MTGPKGIRLVSGITAEASRDAATIYRRCGLNPELVRVPMLSDGAPDIQSRVSPRPQTRLKRITYRCVWKKF